MYHVYPEDLLNQLLRHGIRPRQTTPPELVMDFVADLYRYELRQLRDRLVRGGIPKKEYASHVIELRKRYWLLSVPLRHWTTGPKSGNRPTDA